MNYCRSDDTEQLTSDAQFKSESWLSLDMYKLKKELNDFYVTNA